MLYSHVRMCASIIAAVVVFLKKKKKELAKSVILV